MDERYKWENLESFWFSRKDDQFILNVDTNLRLPGKLVMLVDGQDLVKMKDLMVQFVPYRVVNNQGYVSKIVDGEWIDMIEDSDKEVIPG